MGFFMFGLWLDYASRELSRVTLAEAFFQIIEDCDSEAIWYSRHVPVLV